MSDPLLSLKNKMAWTTLKFLHFFFSFGPSDVDFRKKGDISITRMSVNDG